VCRLMGGKPLDQPIELNLYALGKIPFQIMAELPVTGDTDTQPEGDAPERIT
jgi:hypothetical protein